MPNNAQQEALDRIRAFKAQTPQNGGWKLDISVWRMIGEGVGVFAGAFLVGLGLGLCYVIITDLCVAS